MTSSGKIRIYELSKDLGLENKDVLDAAHKLSIAAKSHSSSINEDEAKRITDSLKTRNKGITPTPTTKPQSGKVILSVKKAPQKTNKPPELIAKKSESHKSPEAPQKTNKPPELIAKKSESHKSPEAPQKPKSPLKPAVPSQSPKVPQLNPKSPIRKAPTNINATSKSQSSSRPQKSTNSPVNRPSPPPSRPVPPSASIKPSAPIRPNSIKNPDNNRPKSPPSLAESPKNNSKPKILGRSQPSQGSYRSVPPSKPPLSGQKKPARPELVGRPQPRRPVAPPSRPSMPQDKRRSGSPSRNSGGGQNQRFNPQRNNQGSPRANAPIRNPNRAGQPRSTGNPVELVGKPIRRDKNVGSQSSRDSGSRQAPQSRSNMPPGMRKPVAPGELMQLQKPTGRPGVPAPKRPDGTTVGPKGATDGTGNKELNRPTPAPAPKRPAHRPSIGAPRRTGKPDWDDSAKLEALRSKSPQKQRQKVHIIGENDDALTTETSGFAGEKQATLLSASLARPAKPKTANKSASKPMAAMRKRKKETTRQRQRRRAMELRAAREAKQVRPEMIIVPEANLTVQELSDMLSVESSEVIKSLFFKGITATVTQSLDLSTIETVAEEFGVPVLQDDVQEAAKKTSEIIEESDLKHLIRRPPVVTVMGHVDHGKTSLLDAIRKARVAAGEAGGITQHIGAYQVEISHAGESKKLTFLDTPGHEAFTAMRARGTKVTDVAVLVVAADDGVRPQTLEAISHARAAEVPIVVAINKIDKEGSSPDRVKQELSEQSLVAEEWGGDVVMVPVSAIKGENIDKLLEMILLVTEVEDLQANPDRLAKGTVIEAHLDKAKGPVATLLIQNGTLKTGDVVAAGPVLGKVRAMVDENGARLKASGPSTAVEALGFNEVPTAGDEFEVYPDEKSARAVVGERASDARATRLAQQMASRRVSLSAMSGQANEGELQELNIILKADVQGSVEAILGSLEQLPKDEVQVRVLLSAPGEITETDVDLAAASGAVIVGFNTSMASGAKRAADATGVDVRDYEVIYKLLEDIQLAMEGLLEPEMIEESLGTAEVRAIFTIGKSSVAGCYITNGKLQRNCRVRVNRKNQIVFEGDLDSLRRNKDDVKEVATGFECGIGCDRFANWQEGDTIEAYKFVTQKRKLNV